jgi:membrane protein implicated in regulation of membrane protease activity
MRRASSELVAVHIGLAVIAVLGVTSALWPAVEFALNTACFGALAIAALLAGLRWLARFVRERIEDRADARYAAAVRAAAQERETIQ